MDPVDDRIRELAASLPTLALRAVGAYAPIVDSLLAGRSRDVPAIERTLDGLLDFGFDPAALGLFERLCRHYHDIDPAAAAAYVAAYRDMWDPDARSER
jgi:hypothetical protein